MAQGNEEVVDQVGHFVDDLFFQAVLRTDDEFSRFLPHFFENSVDSTLKQAAGIRLGRRMTLSLQDRLIQGLQHRRFLGGALVKISSSA